MFTIVTSIDNHFLHLVNLIHVKTMKKAIVRYLCLGFAGFMGNYNVALEISNTGQKRSTSRPSIQDRLSWLPIHKTAACKFETP